MMSLFVQRLVTAHHPHMKLPMRPSMLEAMAMDANLSDDADLRDICSYYMLFFAGFRIGTITASPHDVRRFVLFAVLRALHDGADLRSLVEDTPSRIGSAVLDGHRAAAELAVLPGAAVAVALLACVPWPSVAELVHGSYV